MYVSVIYPFIIEGAEIALSCCFHQFADCISTVCCFYLQPFQKNINRYALLLQSLTHTHTRIHTYTFARHFKSLTGSFGFAYANADCIFGGRWVNKFSSLSLSLSRLKCMYVSVCVVEKEKAITKWKWKLCFSSLLRLLLGLCSIYRVSQLLHTLHTVWPAFPALKCPIIFDSSYFWDCVAQSMQL